MKKTLIFSILLSFFLNTLGPLPQAQAQELVLPTAGIMVHASQPLNPPILKGIKVHTDNPFRFDFILDKGECSDGKCPDIKEESTRLIKYFLASLTTPEGDLWVNLSPYEKDRIVPASFGQTEMGRDLLAQDYLLKQVTASLIYPEDKLGKKFWKRIYEEAQAKYGTTNIPVNTFNKVWIVPEKAVVYEKSVAGTAYVVEAQLRVMLEIDYLSLEKNIVGAGPRPASFAKGANQREGAGLEPARTDVNQLGSQIVREIVIPALTREVNEGANFAQLRQVYNSLILATWYKKKIKDSILAKVYADQNKVAGVGYSSSVIASEAKQSFKQIASSPSAPRNDTSDVEAIYNQYLQAFKKGVYNYIKEEPEPATGNLIPRKYFSGGMLLSDPAMKVALSVIDVNQASPAMLSSLLSAGRKTRLIVTAALSLAASPVVAQNNSELDPMTKIYSEQLKDTRLRSSDRTFAARQLGGALRSRDSKGQLEIVKVLVEALKDTDEDVMTDVLRELYGIKGMDVEKSVMNLLHHPKKAVRRYAAYALSPKDSAIPQEVAEALIQALKDASEDVREYAAKSLHYMDSLNLSKETQIKIQAALAEAFNHAKGDILRREIITSLNVEIYPEARGIFKRAMEDKIYLWEHLKAIRAAEGTKDPLLIDTLIQMMLNVEDEPAEVRRTAMHSLQMGQIKSEVVVNALLSVLEKDPDDGNRATVLLSIGSLNESRFISILIKALEDPSPKVIAAAAKELNGLRAREQGVTEALVKALKHQSDPLVQEAIASSLANGEFIQAARSLVEVFNNPNTTLRVRLHVAGLLGIFSARSEVKEALIAVIKDLDQDVELRSSCAESLKNGTRDDPKTTKVLLEVFIKDPSPQVKLAAIEALSANDESKGYTFKVYSTAQFALDSAKGLKKIPVVKDVLSEEIIEGLVAVLDNVSLPSELRVKAAKVLGQKSGAKAEDALIRILNNDADPKVRAVVANGLGSPNNLKATEALMTALANDTEVEVRVNAADSLLSSSSSEVTKALSAALASDVQPIKVKITIVRGFRFKSSIEVTDALLNALNEQDTDLVVAVVGALGSNRNDPRVIQTLINLLLSQPKEEIRKEAESSFRRLGLDSIFTLNRRGEQHLPFNERFKDFVSMDAKTLYFLMTFGREEAYTSTYMGLMVLFLDRMKMEGLTGDELFKRLGNVNSRYFISMAANYGTLWGEWPFDPSIKREGFLQTMTSEQQQKTLKDFVQNLDQLNDVELNAQGANVAETLFLMRDNPDVIKTLKETVLSEYKRVKGSGNRRAEAIYGLLVGLVPDSGLFDDEWLKYIGAKYNLTHLKEIDIDQLKDSKGRIVQRHFFYNNEDGDANYGSFISGFQKEKDLWKVTENKSKGYVLISSRHPEKNRQVLIYANMPNKQDEGNEAIEKAFKEEDLVASVIVHRGHSTTVRYTIEHITSGAKIVILGSCGGENELPNVFKLSPEASIIATKRVGRRAINDPIIYLMTNMMLNPKVTSFRWNQVKKAVGLDVNTNTGYVFPHENLKLIFIRALNEILKELDIKPQANRRNYQIERLYVDAQGQISPIFHYLDSWPNRMVSRGLSLNHSGLVSDAALLTNTGGIDFNSDKMNLQTRNESGEIKFNLDPDQLQALQNAAGFTPVIINIQPMTDLRGFLGLSDAKEGVALAKA